jgi:hypothetical protein
MRTEAHFSLGGVYVHTGEPALGLAAFLAAFDAHTPGCKGWAQCAVMAYGCIRALKNRKLVRLPLLTTVPSLMWQARPHG